MNINNKIFPDYSITTLLFFGINKFNTRLQGIKSILIFMRIHWTVCPYSERQLILRNIGVRLLKYRKPANSLEKNSFQVGAGSQTCFLVLNTSWSWGKPSNLNCTYITLNSLMLQMFNIRWLISHLIKQWKFHSFAPLILKIYVYLINLF